MRIATYCITFPEEYDILPNMIGQAAKLGDVWLIDGGPDGHLCHHPKKGLNQWAIQRMSETGNFIYTRILWPGNPGTQRNSALAAMEPYNYDWIIHNDSDELWTDQAIEQIPSYLAGLKPSITNVLVWLLPLIGNEDHYCRRFATHLVHGRIHRPGTVKWGETWHEHQFFEGERVRSELALIHTELLFEDRLRRIKGHGLEGWGFPLDQTPLPPDKFGLTWPELQYPEEECSTL